MKFYHWCLIAVVALEIVAMLKGLDGLMFASAIAGILGVGGFLYGRKSKG